MRKGKLPFFFFRPLKRGKAERRQEEFAKKIYGCLWGEFIKKSKKQRTKKVVEARSKDGRKGERAGKCGKTHKKHKKLIYYAVWKTIDMREKTIL